MQLEKMPATYPALQNHWIAQILVSLVTRNVKAASQTAGPERVLAGCLYWHHFRTKQPLSNSFYLQNRLGWSLWQVVTLQMHCNHSMKGLDETEGHERSTRCLNTLQETLCLTVKPWSSPLENKTYTVCYSASPKIPLTSSFKALWSRKTEIQIWFNKTNPIEMPVVKQPSITEDQIG